MQPKLLLITPPFTQLNTAYPATAYLKGFLEEKGIATEQCDLSIELFTIIFNSEFLELMFQEAKELGNFNFPAIIESKAHYCSRVDKVIAFLQQQDIANATEILKEDFLPQGHRLSKVNSQISWAEGEEGIIDKAKHYSTLFIEELGDFIQANVDEFFSFTRYAEQISTSSSSFDQLEEFLNYQPTII